MCDDVELYVCDDVELAQEFVYVAGDPINFRDPWGLKTQAEDAGAQATGEEPDWVSPDAKTKRYKKKEAESDCDQTCEDQRERNRRAEEIRRNNEQTRLELQEERRAARVAAAAPATDRDALDDLADAAKRAWGRAKDAWGDFVSGVSPGPALVDLSNGMHRGGGAVRPGSILDKSRETTEGAILSQLPGPEGIALGTLARRLSPGLNPRAAHLARRRGAIRA